MVRYHINSTIACLSNSAHDLRCFAACCMHAVTSHSCAFCVSTPQPRCLALSRTHTLAPHSCAFCISSLRKHVVASMPCALLRASQMHQVLPEAARCGMQARRSIRDHQQLPAGSHTGCSCGVGRDQRGVGAGSAAVAHHGSGGSCGMHIVQYR
jgi:hypothetical protein